MNRTILLTALAAATLAPAGYGAIVLSDSFTYADGPLIGNIPPVGPGLPWNTHSGVTPGQVNVLGGEVIVTQAETEDVNAPIAPTGFAFQSGTVVATFDITFTTLPTAAGTYFTHFKDPTVSGFRGRLFATTTGAGAGTFRLGIADSSTTFTALAADLSLTTTYSVLLTVNAATGRSSFSIDGGTTTTTATDTTSPLPISSYAFRQSTNEGIVEIDNLVIDASDPATVIVPEPTTVLTLVSGLGMLGLLRRRATRA